MFQKESLPNFKFIIRFDNDWRKFNREHFEKVMLKISFVCITFFYLQSRNVLNFLSKKSENHWNLFEIGLIRKKIFIKAFILFILWNHNVSTLEILLYQRGPTVTVMWIRLYFSFNSVIRTKVLHHL